MAWTLSGHFFTLWVFLEADRTWLPALWAAEGLGLTLIGYRVHSGPTRLAGAGVLPGDEGQYLSLLWLEFRQGRPQQRLDVHPGVHRGPRVPPVGHACDVRYEILSRL